MSLYADYLAEKTNDFIIEDDRGFVSYRFIDENQVYICDLYVKPEFRRTKAATELLDKVVEIANFRGCTKMVGAIHVQFKDTSTSILFQLAYGGSIVSAQNNIILLSKNI